MNNKLDFNSWLDKVMGRNSNAGPSYMKSLDWLSEKFYEKGGYYGLNCATQNGQTAPLKTVQIVPFFTV